MPKRILIVEDDEQNMRFFTALLQLHGYDTIQAYDGFRGVELASACSPDLVLMDIGLPGMSGLQAVCILKQDENIRHIPVLAMTEWAMKSDKVKIHAAGCNGFITKPVSISHFIETVALYSDQDSVQSVPSIDVSARTQHIPFSNSMLSSITVPTGAQRDTDNRCRL